MKNELLTIGPITIYGYGLMIAIGIIAAYLTGEYRAKKHGLEADHVFNYVIWCVLGGFPVPRFCILLQILRISLQTLPEFWISQTDGWYMAELSVEFLRQCYIPKLKI